MRALKLTTLFVLLTILGVVVIVLMIPVCIVAAFYAVGQGTAQLWASQDGKLRERLRQKMRERLQNVTDTTESYMDRITRKNKGGEHGENRNPNQ